MKKLILGAVFALFALTSFANNEIPNENLLHINTFETSISVSNVDNVNISDFIYSLGIQMDIMEDELPWCVRLALAVTGLMEDAGISGELQLAVASEIGSWC